LILMTVRSDDRYKTVTEVAGDEVAVEQIQRMADRYVWATRYCADKDVVEVACGTGQGLGLLAASAKSVEAGDISAEMVELARKHYANKVVLHNLRAEEMPFSDGSKDVIVIFEALYYLPDVDLFLTECRRVLRPGGTLLIATANKNLPDFSPSPYSHAYYGVEELSVLMARHGFSASFYGNTPLERVSLRQRMLRPVKAAAVRLHLMPKTMAGKKLFKRIMFGALVAMPPEISAENVSGIPPQPVASDEDSRGYKVLFCAATQA
jgi:SAM-dependent methyltransferase